MSRDAADILLVARVRDGDEAAWTEFINRFEGRLVAFVESRIRDRALSEDVVQETFLGFLISLPNYNEATPLESFLFAIAAHKLTDVLRRQGRRPAISLTAATGDNPLPDSGVRMASSMARSQERRGGEEQLLRDTLSNLVARWRDRGEFERLKCIELLWGLGWSNKDAAIRLGITEQAVANHKQAALTKLKDAARQSRQDLDLSGLDE